MVEAVNDTVSMATNLADEPQVECSFHFAVRIDGYFDIRYAKRVF